MKAFFEEYGFIVIAAIVVLLLIGMASPIGEAIQTSINSLVEQLTNQAISNVPSV